MKPECGCLRVQRLVRRCRSPILLGLRSNFRAVDFPVEDFFREADFFAEPDFFAAFVRDLFADALFGGGAGRSTPSLLASESPIAIACFGFFARPCPCFTRNWTRTIRTPVSSRFIAIPAIGYVRYGAAAIPGRSILTNEHNIGVICPASHSRSTPSPT